VRILIAIGAVLLAGVAIGVGVGTALDDDDSPERASSRDGALPRAAPARSCKRTRRPVLVDQEGRVFRHALYAIRLGHPQLLHKGEQGTSDRNRRAWIRKQGKRFPTRDGFHRDEYPPAMAVEGGEDTHLRYIPEDENEDQGRQLGIQTRAYCPGQAFIYVDLPGQ
jgi:hypothetical protein